MKTVQFKGESCAVEDWANYITMDDDGGVWVWESQPHKDYADGCYFCLVGNREYLKTFHVFDPNYKEI